jgi:hypothetical protein
VEDSLYPLLEAGGVYIQLYRQPEGGGVEYVSNIELYSVHCTGSQKVVEEEGPI